MSNSVDCMEFSVGDQFEGAGSNLLWRDFQGSWAELNRRTLAFDGGDKATVLEVFDPVNNPAPCAEIKWHHYPVLRLEINGELCLLFSADVEWESYFRPLSPLRLLAECVNDQVADVA